MFTANFLSSTARKVCKVLHFTPRFYEPLNLNVSSKIDENGELVDLPRLRVWNARREIIITDNDLEYARNYL